MPHRLSLELCERALKVGERRLGMSRSLRSARPFDLVQRPHRLSDWRGQFEQLTRHVRIPL
jgi:hypothetical protein